MSTILTPNINPRKQSKNTKTFYDGGISNHSRSLKEVQRLYGPNAVKKAREIVKEYANEDTKRLLLTDLGNDIPTLHRVLEFADQADRRREQAFQEEEESGGFYDNSPSMVRDRAKVLEEGIRDDFQKMVNVEAKQDMIKREGPLEMI